LAIFSSFISFQLETALLLQGILTLKPLVAMGLKPGPKPDKKDGTPDRRRRVDPPNAPKHPDLKPHKHKKGD
jgi:hypothetical protein